MKFPKLNFPTTLVIFGVTGDLSQHKLLPALLDLYLKDYLPSVFRIVGFSRREFSHAEFREWVRETLATSGREYPAEKLELFLSNMFYQRGQFEEAASYGQLAEFLIANDDVVGQCTNKLFYLAVPPIAYETIFTNLAHSGLTIPCADDTGWTRVLVEKPFGKDLKTARSLDILLGKLFKEEQIFRIDHYLAKEALQNILTFRFSNTLFEPVWNNQWIDRVEIRLWETGDVSDRGAFYDDIGALRDVGQNHALQMLALVAMDHPGDLGAEHIREKRAEVLRKVKLLYGPERSVVRGQYAGYKSEKGVRSDSMTETYFRIEAEVDNDRWDGVPFMLESGKALREKKVEIVVHFKAVDPCFCTMEHAREHSHSNRIVFEIQPNERIGIRFWSKRPGIEQELEARDFSFDSSFDALGGKQSAPDAYEKILFDCITGDQTLFASTEEITASWRFVTPILEEWSRLPLHIYEKGGDGACVKE